ncbi:uncharacterized protein [Henckelia pumila]|uniref:uncharacterized protein n=1 Tax=Henckelia pumila TaxID=405737 RepID=UPI003C6DE48E
MTDEWRFYVKGSKSRIPLIYVLSMTHLLQKGAEGYLVYAVDVTKTSLTLADLPVVSESLMSFLMKSDVDEYVSKCMNCQQVKAERKKPGGLLQSLSIPEWKWDHISMDFVMKLPCSSQGCDAIWMEDLYVKEVVRLHGVPNLIMADLYVKEVVRLHGVPKLIVSDRDHPRFTSYFCHSLQQALGSADHRYWDDVKEVPEIGPDMIREMTDKISPFRGTVRFGKQGNLSPRFIEPYEILEKICDLAYRLALPPALSGIHDVLHVSMLRKYQPDLSHTIQVDEAELDDKLSYFEKPIAYEFEDKPMS